MTESSYAIIEVMTWVQAIDDQDDDQRLVAELSNQTYHPKFATCWNVIPLYEDVNFKESFVRCREKGVIPCVQLDHKDYTTVYRLAVTYDKFLALYSNIFSKPILIQ